MKIRMTMDAQGIAEGTELDVSEDRATRWVFDKGIAEFVERKDKATIVKKVEQAKKEVEKADKELNKKLDKLEEV
jgi:hypothetical protein